MLLLVERSQRVNDACPLFKLVHEDVGWVGSLLDKPPSIPAQNSGELRAPCASEDCDQVIGKRLGHLREALIWGNESRYS